MTLSNDMTLILLGLKPKRQQSRRAGIALGRGAAVVLVHLPEREAGNDPTGGGVQNFQKPIRFADATPTQIAPPLPRAANCPRAARVGSGGLREGAGKMASGAIKQENWRGGAVATLCLPLAPVY